MEETRKKHRDQKRLLKIIAVILLAVLACIAVLVAMNANSDSAVGHWEVKKLVAGDTVMTQKDAEAIGLSGIGYIRLNRSGSCEVKLYDRETKGKWTEKKDGTIRIKYGGESMKASIDEKGVMTAVDSETTKYILEK